MPEVLFEVDREGKVRAIYRGFVGSSCLEQAKRIVQALRNLGAEVETEKLEPTPEYFQAGVRQEVRERNGGV
jgi:hypothetical protein